MFEREANCRFKAGDFLSAAVLYRDRTVPRQLAKAAECLQVRQLE
jgi:hypothetical protein